MMRRRLTRADDEALRFVAFHGGRCAVCDSAENDLVVDHEHWTGLVRGLVCNGCNVIEGSWRADELPLFTRYRRRHPAALLDYFESYKPGSVSHIVIALDRRERIRERNFTQDMQALINAMGDLREHHANSTLICAPDHHCERRLSKGTAKALAMWEAGSPDAPSASAPSLGFLQNLGDLMTVVEDACERALRIHTAGHEEPDVSLAAAAASWIPPWERPGYDDRRWLHRSGTEPAALHLAKIRQPDQLGLHINQLRELHQLTVTIRQCSKRLQPHWAVAG